MSVDRGWVKILNSDNDLRHSLAFGGSPWKVEVERAKGIEPSYEAWEAAVLPLNYTREIYLFDFIAFLSLSPCFCLSICCFACAFISLPTLSNILELSVLA